ncbi:P-loop containing nucleoside triphosphate hydrolase protein [Podospora didyma]|uniref:ATP-dependent RNA helicase n=1 Tax=Podospora didyma TaxID=330526 RepID=A0AAE0TVW9_9PEZI|nr:P-loop containing nucleoside triphosphate hydrolase protein [Podospora didyma]
MHHTSTNMGSSIKPAVKADNTDKKRKLTKTPAGQAKRQKTVSKRAYPIDALPWKTVEVGEMYDDAEGFYGLEEVEGVEIVKEGETVKFVSIAKPAEVTAEDPAEESEEFAGFDDEPMVDADADVESENGTAPAKNAKTQKGVAKDQKMKDQKHPKDQKKTAKEQKKVGTKDQKKKQSKEDAKPPVEDEDNSELESDVFTKLEEMPDVSDDEEIDMSEWEPLNLSPEMLASIAHLKFSSPTPIQARSIPEIMEGHDVVGKAATGSGKTLAFGVPIVERWLAQLAAKQPSSGEEAGDEENKNPVALILAPTRELAHQIKDHFKRLCDGLPNRPYICCVTGGLSMQKQQRQLENANIIIGTPGRLWEVLSTSVPTLAALRKISFLVVDEADRLLKDGHFKEAEEILKALDRPPTTSERENDAADDDSDEDEDSQRKQRQTLVFSATFNKNLQQKLAGKARFNLSDDAESMEYLLKKLNFREEKPVFIDTNPISQMAERLKEGLIQCGDMEKDLYLYAILLLQPTRRALVFTNSINSVRRLTPLLQSLGLPAFALHSDMAQKARMRSIERFKEASDSPTGKASSILIATDVAARGLDIPNIGLVVHYHVPRSADDYVHRSGRTARASNSGISILMCGPKEAVPTQRLVAKVHASAGSSSRIGRFATKLKEAGSGKGGLCVHNIDIDRKLVARLRERVVLAKKITDSSLAKEKGRKEDTWMRSAAEELGVEYDSDELENAGQWSGRGSGRKRTEKEARSLTKQELAPLKAQLREMLSKRINTGVSELYLDGLDINELQHGTGEFIGRVDGLGLDDL